MSTDVRLAPRSKFQERYLTTDSDIIVAGGAMGCVPAETEFLTPTGWKQISEYREGDRVGVVHLDSSDYHNTKLVFEEPYRFVKEPCKEMNYIESKRFKMTLSPEHRVVRSEEHTSELQSRGHLVCRLLLEK